MVPGVFPYQSHKLDLPGDNPLLSSQYERARRARSTDSQSLDHPALPPPRPSLLVVLGMLLVTFALLFFLVFFLGFLGFHPFTPSTEIIQPHR